VARLLCHAFVERGHHVVSGQLHGMAQRGGSVQSSVIIDSGISPVIASGRAGFVLGYEPVETARALPFMSSHTLVYMNTTPVIPYVLGQRYVLKESGADYPDVERLSESIRAVTSHSFAFDATQMALEAGSATTLNIVMLGCLLGSETLPRAADEFWDIAAKRMPAAFAEVNSRAFWSGVQTGAEFLAGTRAS
jgi:indolepyruvate ferredoxin oxidoreductase beta subunit